MAITVIETITLTTPVGEGIYRKDFQKFLWIHIDKAPWRDQMSFDVFMQGGLVILTPGDPNGHTDVRVINQASGLTNIPVDQPGEQLIRGIFKENSTDPGIEFWYSILVGGIDYNPSSTFPEKRDDFGPMKQPAVAGDIPAIDYYQYLISAATKSKTDLNVLKSLKETLTPKMILAKDINWLRNSVIAVQRAYFELKEKMKELENKIAGILERLGLLEIAFEELRDYVYNDLTPRVEALEDAVKNIEDNLLPNGLRSARNNTMQRVYKNLQSYGTGGPGDLNWAMMDTVQDNELYDADNNYQTKPVGQNILLKEFFKTLIVQTGEMTDPATGTGGSNKVIIQNNRICMFRGSATESDIMAGTNYEAMLYVQNNATVLDLARSSGVGEINIGNEAMKLWIKGNKQGGWLTTGVNPQNSGPGIAMIGGTDASSISRLGLMGNHLSWHRPDGGAGLVNWGYGGSAGIAGSTSEPYIYQSFGIGSTEGYSGGYAIVKSQEAGGLLAYTGRDGKSCGIRMTEDAGLEFWGEGGMAAAPGAVQTLLDTSGLREDMHGGAYKDSPRAYIND